MSHGISPAEGPVFKLIRSCLGRCAGFGAVALTCACSQPPDDSVQQQVQERLVGTWLREYHDGSAKVRRVLVLNSDGRFSERAVATAAGALVAEHSHAGEWRFDGTNLKRRYTRMNGRKPSAPTVPFLTFEVRFESPDDLVGVDNVRRHQVRYRRVVEGTAP